MAEEPPHLDEVAALRERVAALESELSRRAEDSANVALSLSPLQATLDATSDGILVVDRTGRIASYNRRFLELWRIPPELASTRDDRLVLGHVISQLLDPAGFVTKVEELYNQPLAESYDLIEFADGRVFERSSKPQLLNGEAIGRVWCFSDISDRRQRENMRVALQEGEQRYERMVASVPGMVYQFCMRPDGTTKFLFVSEGCREIYRASPEEIMADSSLVLSIAHPEDAEILARSIQESAVTLLPWKWEGRAVFPDGQTKWLQGVSRPAKRENGDIVWDGLLVDITQRKQAEQEASRVRMQEQVIAAQQAALSQLSTPLIPLTDHVVVMPLIGAIDSGRAEQVLDTLLNGVSRLQARIAILDITGVTLVDSHVAHAVVRAAQAVRLLGAEVILTGIRADVAQTLVRMGVDLGSLHTRGTLQSAIAFALGRGSPEGRRPDPRG